jgi:hypothetical protein
MFKLKLVKLVNIFSKFVKFFNFWLEFFCVKFILYPINTEFDQKLKFIPDFNRFPGTRLMFLLKYIFFHSNLIRDERLENRRNNCQLFG